MAASDKPSKAAGASSGNVVSHSMAKHTSPQKQTQRPLSSVPGASTSSSSEQPDLVLQQSHQQPVEHALQQPHQQQQLQQQQQELLPAARRVLVDQRQKWQRISEWITRDSNEAAAVASRKEVASTNSTAGNSSTSLHQALTGVQRQPLLQITTAAPPEEDDHGIISVTELRYSLDTAVIELAAARSKPAEADEAAPPFLAVSVQQLGHCHVPPTLLKDELKPFVIKDKATTATSNPRTLIAIAAASIFQCSSSIILHPSTTLTQLFRRLVACCCATVARCLVQMPAQHSAELGCQLPDNVQQRDVGILEQQEQEYQQQQQPHAPVQAQAALGNAGGLLEAAEELRLAQQV
jgi:hypothetical protein